MRKAQIEDANPTSQNSELPDSLFCRYCGVFISQRNPPCNQQAAFCDQQSVFSSQESAFGSLNGGWTPGEDTARDVGKQAIFADYIRCQPPGMIGLWPAV